eukprot:GFUD01025604.1.p1 GENE.GFUD01025604.1~~GFUD01025604.1.p1  ORF type:complete len:567 (+),score=140.62 GFUD01025604.1:112-1812(+)
MCSCDQYDTVLSVLSEEYDMCDDGEEMSDKDDHGDEHSNNKLTMEEVGRILDLPAYALTDVLDTEKDPQKDRRFSYSSTETNSLDDMDFWVLESTNSEVSKHSTDFGSHESQHFKIKRNLSNSLDNTLISMSTDLKTGWLTDSITQVKIENDESLDEQQISPNKNTEDAAVKIKDEESSCFVCSKPALKHCSYGGKVCSSCRSFFRRSVQSGYHTIYGCKQDRRCKMDPEKRSKCQFCRFQSCLRSGMKITWVLSDQERERRFNKLKKIDKKVNKSDAKQICQSVTRPSVIHLSFSLEEKNILNDLRSKFQVPWLQNLFKFDRNAGVNLVEYVFRYSDPKVGTWDAFKQSMGLNFIRFILPRFQELSDLSSHDVGQLMNSPGSGIAQLFRSCHMFHMGSKMKGKEETCTVASTFVTMSSNLDIVTSLNLHGLLSRLDLSKGVSNTRMAAYEDLYPDGWAGDRGAERRHKEAVYKIVNWPRDDENVFDYWMVTLMSLILVFNADFYTLVSRDRVEKIQLKFIMILKRYLKFKLTEESANRKFLEAMLLIAETRHAWEISCGYGGKIY